MHVGRRASDLEQWFIHIVMCQITGGLVKLKCLGPTPQVSDSVVPEQGLEFTSLASSWVMLILSVQAPSFEECGSHTLSAFSVVLNTLCCFVFFFFLVRVASSIWAMILHCFRLGLG